MKEAMASDLDRILDRRRLKRRLSFWRLAAIALAAALAAFFLARFAGPMAHPHIARLAITGVITADSARDQLLHDIATNTRARALILRINSPGGTTAGSEALFHAIRAVAAKKPVVAVIGTLGASGGYITALAADYIVARETSLTGSIGVIFQSPEFSGLFKKLGVGVNEVKSSPLKGGPSPFAKMDDQTRRVLQGMIDDSYDWFVGLVAERRGLDLETTRRLADGRVYTGRQALKAALIDALGGEEVARAWLADARKVAADLPVVDMDIDASTRLWRELGAFASGKRLFPERLALDGLVSLWQPEP